MTIILGENVNMEYYVTIIATLMAAIVAWTGYQQYYLAKGKFKLDLFDKRFAVYKGVQEFLSIILRHAKYEISQLYDFRRNTQDAMFLFGNDIPEYIKMIDKKALAMRSYAHQYEALPKGPERSDLVEKETQLLTELTGELPRLQVVFSPYLSFAKWK